MHTLFIILTCTSCRYSCVIDANSFNLRLSRDARDGKLQERDVSYLILWHLSAQQNEDSENDTENICSDYPQLMLFSGREADGLQPS